MRPIDADALDKILADAEVESRQTKRYVLQGAINTIRGNVAKMPTIEPERKTGKWIIRTRHEHFPSGKEYTELVCSECGRTDHNGDVYYCGYCGCKMEVQDEAD